jgi:hypothetical protein
MSKIPLSGEAESLLNSNVPVDPPWTGPYPLLMSSWSKLESPTKPEVNCLLFQSIVNLTGATNPVLLLGLSL